MAITADTRWLNHNISCLISLSVQVYKQKMKHLLCEHQSTVSELKANNSVSVGALQKEQEQIEMTIHKKMRNVLVDTQELDIEHLVKDLELVCSSQQILGIC